MAGLFGNNSKNWVTLEEVSKVLSPLFERIEILETYTQDLEERVDKLKQRIDEWQEEAKKTDSSAAAAEDDYGPVPVGITIQDIDTDAAIGHPTQRSSQFSAQTIYLPAPTPEGNFVESSDTEQVGKSIYQLRTEDGTNGQFIMLNTPDAIATAMISISQFVKPVCRIEGNVHQVPHQIDTLEEGVAQRDGTVWKVTRKARVLFQ